MKIPTVTATAVDPLLTKQEVGRLLSISRATIDRWVRENPDFPQPIRVTEQTIRWRASEVSRFIAGLPRVAYDDHAFDPNQPVGSQGPTEPGGNAEDDVDHALRPR